MAIITVPAEIQDEILFRIVLGNARLYELHRVITSDIVPYIQSNRHALECWRTSRHVILHRVARIHLAGTDYLRKMLRRMWVLARLRWLVWNATLRLFDGDIERFTKPGAAAFNAFFYAERNCHSEERKANYWRNFLIG
jgi:hypothetical protein